VKILACRKPLRKVDCCQSLSKGHFESESFPKA
jgi:hypothetical protein